METIVWLIWSIIMLAILWIMPNKKIRVLFGELRKTLQILPITKIAQAIISYNKKEK